jgi:hypothetical protein
MTRLALLLVCSTLIIFAQTQPEGTVDEVSPFVELFGDSLYRWKNDMKPNEEGKIEIEELPTSQLLSGKRAVAIYFSGMHHII